mmetsp:Transcript_28097/g.36816  ORF Transcript_28097/g.36816 Transcript_28097/m.36816 type:complete len:206 (-) Transcript_28097:127-744(-)|eukprot:CAMPEP_0117756378 /NCGR_PEP_ID=MMETSP0947-20121206/14041_1 /TAXON_ID=44440 /ORGANISM="Chattonella subsalsa, Strain CCMP2191" /LENGTH=205 /DNA_ID=CAMNT_0005575951 /DNA_START=36 /DNA_END=653 /DNA_ORIENTATION=+
MADYDELYKIVIVGDTSVGKTNLLAQYTHEDEGGYFDPHQRPTIGVEFGTRTILHPDGTKIKAQIWDTAGQERYRSIANSHYRRAAGAIIVYDVTNPQSLKSVKNYWIGEVKKAAEPDSVLNECIMLIGNKIDLISAVSEKQHNATASEIGVSLHGLTSAKTAQNVGEAFEKLLFAIYETSKRKNVSKKKGINLEKANKNSDGCC